MSEPPPKLPDDESKRNRRHQDPTCNHHKLDHHRKIPVGLCRNMRPRNRSQGDLHRRKDERNRRENKADTGSNAFLVRYCRPVQWFVEPEGTSLRGQSQPYKVIQSGMAHLSVLVTLGDSRVPAMAQSLIRSSFIKVS